MIIPLKLATFKNERTVEFIKNEVILNHSSLELNICYYYDQEDPNTKEWKEGLFCNEHVRVKRELLNGYVNRFNNEEEVWEIRIFILGSQDLVFSFDTEFELKDFTELLRKYIFEDMKCTT